MSDTLLPIPLPDGVWVDLYAQSGIPVGTRIRIENIGSISAVFYSGASAPVGDHGEKPFRPWEAVENSSGDKGAWAKSEYGNGVLLVRISHQQSLPGGPQQALIYQSAFRDGIPQDAVGRNQNVDGSLTPVRFKVAPPAGQIWNITRMVFLMRDDGVFDSGGWGNQTPAAPLPNGMSLGTYINGVEYNSTPIPWVTVADLAGVAYDLTYHAFGQGENFLSVRLTFSRAGQNIRLDGDNGDYIWMDVNDDLTYLTEQRAMFQGFIENVYL